MPTMGMGQERVVFRVGSTEYTGKDVVDAARRRGVWAAVEARARAGLACELRAEAEGDPLPAGALDAAAESFRYARDLISGDDTRAWLGRWGLDEEAWTAALRRGLLREHWADELGAILAPFSPDPAALSAAHWSEAICSGALEEAARALAAEAAAAVADLGEPSTSALERCLALHRLDWLRIRARRLVLPEEPMAREGALRVREDRESLDAVAADAARPLERVDFWLEELPPESTGALAAAAEEELVGPVPFGDGFALYQVVSKQIPRIEDPDVRARARERVRRNELQHACDEHVRWAIGF